MRPLVLLVLLALTGCVASPPDEDPLVNPPGGYDLFPGTSMAVVLVANDSSGSHPATEAHSLDESIVKVVPATLTRTVPDYGETDPGKVFILYGVAPGQADIEVFRDGKDEGAVTVVVVAQDRT